MSTTGCESIREINGRLQLTIGSLARLVEPLETNS